MMNQRSALFRVTPTQSMDSRSPVAGGRWLRRGFLRAAIPLGLAGAALPLLAGCGPAAPRPAPAAAKARVGVLSTGPGPEMPEFEALRRGLRELGYVEGQNLALELAETQAAAPALGVQVQPVEVPGPDQLAAALAATEGAGLDGLLALPDAVFLGLRAEIAGFAAGARLPAMFQEREYAQAGGL